MPTYPSNSSIRNTDDYLTARFANPRTGLVSPSIYIPTPRTPGEALAAFYGDGAAAASLNEYFGLGGRKGVRRPALRRTGVEDVAEYWRGARRMVGSLAVEPDGAGGAMGARRSVRGGQKWTASEVAEVVRRDIQFVPGSYDWGQSSAGLEGDIPTIRISEYQDTRVGSRKNFGLPSHGKGDSIACRAAKTRIVLPCDLAQLPPVVLIHPTEAAIPKRGHQGAALVELPSSAEHSDGLWSLSTGGRPTQILVAAYTVAWTLASILLVVLGIRQAQIISGTALPWKLGWQKFVKHSGAVLRLLCVIYAVFCAWQVGIVAFDVVKRAWWPIVVVLRILKWAFGS